MLDLWVEKYRPQTPDRLIASDSLRAFIAKCIETKTVYTALFVGPPGTGKTTAARILFRALDPEVLELNASDERGIDTVRDKIKKFAMTVSFKSMKVVFLDEADFLTTPAQAVLRNLLEKYSASCRFILTANYKDRIMPAVFSRMQVFEFAGLPVKAQAQELCHILDAEKIEYDLNDALKIVDDSKGDMRKVVNIAQSLVTSNKLVYKSLKDESDMDSLFQLTKDKRWTVLKTEIESGVDTTYILEKLFDKVLEDVGVTVASEVVGEYLFRDSICINKTLNLLCCFMVLSNYLR